MSIKQQLLNTFIDVQSMLNTYNGTVDRPQRVRVTDDTMLVVASVIVGLGGADKPARRKKAGPAKADDADGANLSEQVAEVEAQEAAGAQ